MDLPPGLYERLITCALREALEGEGDSIDTETTELGRDAAPLVLAKHVHDAAARVLRQSGKLENQLELVNRVLGVLADAGDGTIDPTDAVDAPARLLLALIREKRRLGPVRYESHRGERPMQIVWRLERPAPADWYQSVKIAAG